MTAKALKGQNNSFINMIPSFLCLTLAALMIILGDKIKQGVVEGLYFSFMAVIPTLFPFFVLSDFWSAYFTVNETGITGRVFEKLFGINACALSAFLSGLICGFPIGVKTAAELYKKGKISKDEFKRLTGFVNNPSVAFIISGVGVGIFGDIKAGLLLYISVVFSSVTVGILFRKHRVLSQNSSVISRQSFSLVNSIKNAGATSIAVASYIIFFSGVIGLCSSLIKSEALVGIISSVIEVSSATRLIGSCETFTPYARLILTSFALGFSGLSVHLQAISFFPEDVSPIKYFTMKFIQGLFSAVYTMAFVALFR